MTTSCQNPTALPARLREYRNLHAGETFLVCGCGVSLSQVTAPHRFISIGVNDVGRLFQPDYLVVLNSKHQFAGDRFRYVEESRARAIFTQLPLGLRHPRVVHIRLGRRAGTDDADPEALHYTRNSPYLAVCLAMHMGAARIGLIGIDFTDHHFFAQTGRHPLTREFFQIDREYQELARAAERRGVEIVNLSAESRLTAFPKTSPEDFAGESFVDRVDRERVRRLRVFFVHYRFLSCGEVFRTGLEGAATDLGIEHAGGYWNDPDLEERVRNFSPDLLFVVHGRKFAPLRRTRFGQWKSAVWLLDEPYEVDDTARFSGLFDHVFINDPRTLARHRNAHYLPVAYDPRQCTYRPGDPRPHLAGFIGGWNTARERMLTAVAGKGQLSYLVGGPWREPALRPALLAGNISADETAPLYRKTQVALNVFRSVHHYNRSGVEAFSLNPRVYEAAACGAVVLSEYRQELTALWPGAPCFRDSESLLAALDELLGDPAKLEDYRRDCIRAFRRGTYAARLSAALLHTLTPSLATSDRSAFCTLRSQKETSSENNTMIPSLEIAEPALPAPREKASHMTRHVPPELSRNWELAGTIAELTDDGHVVLRKEHSSDPGSEQGLTGKTCWTDVALSFDVILRPGSTFVAKIHQEDATNQLMNSYHVFFDGNQAYVARHHCVLSRLRLSPGRWHTVRVAWFRDRLSVRIDGEKVFAGKDDTLPSGYCFLGIKGGEVLLRNIGTAASTTEDGAATVLDHRILQAARKGPAPEVSIITTVYDRVECLERCLRSVNNVHLRDYEHIVVADCPAGPVLEKLHTAVRASGNEERRIFATLTSRHNNWGIAPAAAGLAIARGRYVAFLSDDNGYLPDHFGPLLAALQADDNLGFAYSSCLYAGRFTLRHGIPRFGGIDLGQPLFRRYLFDQYLDTTLPFTEAAWDWRMIEFFLSRGVRWKHVDRSSFVFRLASYPHLVAALA
jgi:hypothetical protein